MCNEVGEKASGFREVLGGLIWDGEREFELVFILDGLYENGALFIPHFVRGLGNPTRYQLSHLLLVFGPWVIRDQGSPDQPTVGDRREQTRGDLSQGTQRF